MSQVNETILNADQSVLRIACCVKKNGTRDTQYATKPPTS